MTEKTYKLDIFQTLGCIDRKQRDFFDNLTPVEKKAFQPVVVERWLSGTTDARQVVFINELVNPFVFNLSTHPGLLYKLMTVCTTGKQKRYQWIKVGGKKKTEKPKSVAIIQEYFKYTASEAIDALPNLSAEDILSYAEQLGKQKDELAKLKQELK